MAESDRALRHFWLEFDLPLDADCPRGTREGIGVTAVDLHDAIDLVTRVVFPERSVPAIRRVDEDVDFHRLCPWLVLPAMSDPRRRGIWFPAS